MMKGLVMTIIFKKNKKSSMITLPASLGATLATPLHQALCEAMALKNPLTLQAAEVTSCHSLCAQLLAAAHKEYTQHQQPFIFSQPSVYLTEVLHTLGLGIPTEDTA